MAAAVGILWGAVLAIMSVVAIPDALAAQRLIDGARPLVAPDYLEREQALVSEGAGAAKELTTAALPRLAYRLGQSPTRLQSTIASRYPAVATGLVKIPGILTTTATSLGSLQRHHSDFVDADSFPAAGVSRLAASIGGLVFGLVLLALGASVLLTRAWWPLAAIFIVALAGAIAPLVADAPHKAEGVQAMIRSLNLTQRAAEQTRANFNIVQGFHDELVQRLLPDVAAQLGTATDALTADVEGGLDHLAAAQEHYPTTLELFRPDVELREAAFGNFQQIKGIPVAALTWTFVAGCAAVAALAAAALFGGVHRR